MWSAINHFLVTVDNFVWGVPLMILIIAGGILLTARLGFLQIRKLPLALKWMVQNEEEAEGEISSFSALCTALSATIGTGNIVGVATAVCAGGPGALFWMVVTAFFGMATKYSEGLLAVKYRIVAKDGHSLGGPFYYIEQGMGEKWKWLAKIFAFFGVCVGLFGIGTFSQVNGISSAIHNFFDAQDQHCVAIPFCSRSKFLTKLLKTFDKTFREIFPVFISTKRREKPSAFFDNNFVNNAYFSEAASSSSSHLASSSSKAPISSRMTCLCLWSS